MKYKKILRVIGIVALVVVVFGVGAFVGSTNKVSGFLNPASTVVADTTPSSTADLSEFWTVWNLMQKNYPFKEKVPAEKDKVYGAIAGMVASYGDPYTMFFPPKQAKLFNDEVRGSFGGIGAELGMKDKALTVIAPIKGSPAEAAGVKAGDIITDINGKKTDGLDIDTAISLIRGDIGTNVTLGLIHIDGKQIDHVTIKRQVVNLPVIDTAEHGDVYTISLYSFSEDSAKLFKDALTKFQVSGKQKLVIDLRGNPGGYLDAAVDIASYFLPSGATVVQEDSGGTAPRVVHQSRGYTLVSPLPKIVVLVDAGSASASEILAGALSEQGVATLLGTVTYGKGSVQELTELPDGSSVKITVAKWLTPKGVSISEKGITPQVIVKTPPTKDPKTGVITDPQLDAAIKLLDK
ncbi:MAG: ctpA [Patescibacteria group bacterium]|nr:ctpA [Patescibacteria group bacterium]